MTTTTNVERRFTVLPVETRAAAAERRTIGGYAAVFAKQSRNLGGYVETVDTRAFNKARGDGWADVVARHNHDDNMLLGTTAAATLRLHVDDVGLSYEVDVPESRADVYELVQRGDIRQSSFAFIAKEDDWGLSEQKFPERRLLSVKLVDVASVNTPAYPDASVGLRSLADKFDADIAEVRSMAEANDLSKFFTLTDKAAPLTVAHARAEMLKRKSVTFN